MIDTTKDNLLLLLWENYKELRDMVEQLNSDVEYNQELITLRDKHKRYFGDISEEIERIIAKRDTILEVMGIYEDNLEYRGIKINDLESECD